jgi:glycosyltransferase involved in cell wall biosynthesis
LESLQGARRDQYHPPTLIRPGPIMGVPSPYSQIRATRSRNLHHYKRRSRQLSLKPSNELNVLPIIDHMSELRLDIFIPTFNNARTVASTLESLLLSESAAGCVHSVHISIFDGGSTDGTIQIAQSFRSLFSNISIQIYPGVHPAERFNIFLRNSGAGMIANCHSDNLYDMGAILSRAHHAHNHGICALGADFRYYSDPLDFHTGKDESLRTGSQTHPRTHNDITDNLLFWWSLCQATMVYNLKFLRSNNLYLDYRKYRYAADYEFHGRIMRRGAMQTISDQTTTVLQSLQSDGSRHSKELREETQEIKINLMQEDSLFSATCTASEIGLFASLECEYGRFKPIASPLHRDFYRIKRAALRLYRGSIYIRPESTELRNLLRKIIQLPRGNVDRVDTFEDL